MWGEERGGSRSFFLVLFFLATISPLLFLLNPPLLSSLCSSTISHFHSTITSFLPAPPRTRMATVTNQGGENHDNHLILPPDRESSPILRKKWRSWWILPSAHTCLNFYMSLLSISWIFTTWLMLSWSGILLAFLWYF